jgi:hypothetical protein
MSLKEVFISILSILVFSIPVLITPHQILIMQGNFIIFQEVKHLE